MTTTYQIYRVKGQQIIEQGPAHPNPILQHRSRVFKRWIKPVLPELDGAVFSLHLGDGPDQTMAPGMPNLCYCMKRDEDRDLRLVPDAHYQIHRGYVTRWKYRLLYFSRWERKIPRAVFRGSCTGPKPLEVNLRARICQLNHPWIDARISMVNNGWSREELEGLLGPKMSEIKMARYKYQIDVDGNTNSWCGFFWKLMSGSLTFKFSSPWRQWYYGDLLAGTHYVPVESLENFLEKLAYFRDHDDEAKEIASAARLFTKKFRPENQYRAFLEAVRRP